MRPICSWSLGEKIGLVVIVIGLLTAIGFAIDGLVKDRFRTSDSCYLFIFTVNCCFAIIYVVKGIWNEDPYDLAIVVLSVAPPTIYIIVNYVLDKKTTFKEIRLIVGVIFAPCIAGFGLYYFWKFASSKKFMRRYSISTEYDASLSHEINNKMRLLQRCLRTMLLYYFFLNVNLQCDISVAVFTLMSGFAVDVQSWTIHHKETLILFFIVLAFAFLGWLFGHLSVKKEQKRLIKAFGIVSVFLVAAGLYLLVQASRDLHRNNIDHTLSKVAVFTSVLMLFLRLITCLACFLASRNFGKGLKEAVNGHADSERSPLLRQTPITDSSIQYETD